jgi:carboxymethylenebutenolidase
MPELRSAKDGFTLGAHHAPAHGARRGGVVVIQEIFGVTPHIKERCATFAAAGYEALAPSMFDRIERGFEVKLDADGFNRGRAAVAASPWDQVAADVQAAIDALAPPVFVTGFCWGGAVSWLAAARCTGLSGASAFYGRMINMLLDDAPRVPILLHYGAKDPSIPLTAVDEVRARYPALPIHVYDDAGHGFCRQDSADYHASSCALATERTLTLFGSVSSGA